MTTGTETQAIAHAFVTARKLGASLPRFPGKIPETLADAYAVQDCAIAVHGDAIGGWKVGRVNPPYLDDLGVDRLGGPIDARRIVNGAAPVGQVFDGGFGAAEAEFLFRIGHAPPPGKTRFSLDEAAASVDRVHCGIEIASSPLAAINALGPLSVISDFGNNNGLIVGPEVKEWQDSGLEDWDVALEIDGVEAGRGHAAAFNDGPIGSVRFLLELLADRRIALPAGSWISSGAITGVHEVAPGQRVTARFGQRLEATCTIEAVETARI